MANGLAAQRFRFLVENAESLCCGDLVYEQVYPLKDVFHPHATGTRSFLECDRCYNSCSVVRKQKKALSVAAYPSVSTIEHRTFTDEHLLDFVARFRRATWGNVLLPATTLGTVSRYRASNIGDECVSIRTDQKVCPIQRRTHQSNTIVIRFNLTLQTFSVGCFCSPKPFFHCEMVLAHPYNCECFICFKSELAEIYEHE